MVAVTADVAWLLVRKNHAYIMKRDNCKTFSKEAFNLKNIHSAKYNGFVPERVVDVTDAKNKRGVRVSHRTAKRQYMPAKNFPKKTVRKSNQHVFRHIRTLMRGGKCRRDLEMTALARASTILASQKRKGKSARKSKKSKKPTAPTTSQ